MEQTISATVVNMLKVIKGAVDLKNIFANGNLIP